MNVHIIFGQRLEDNALEAIDAWDEDTIENNPEGFEEELAIAKGRIKDDYNPNGDFTNVAVVIVTVNSSQIQKILNPPNKVLGAAHVDPTLPTDGGVAAVKHLRILTEFAYQQGFHELGYDPVAEVAKRLNVETPTAEEPVIKRCKECRQDPTFHKMDCSQRGK
jgi:hypothetical protein